MRKRLVSGHTSLSGWLYSTVVVRIMTVKDAHVLISGTCGSMSLHGNKDNAVGFNIGDIYPWVVWVGPCDCTGSYKGRWEAESQRVTEGSMLQKQRRDGRRWGGEKGRCDSLYVKCPSQAMCLNT